jgi:fumarylacetoacetase
MTLDETHDFGRRSWVASARNHADYPIQNLPLGVFSPASGAPRTGVAIGEMILDLPAALAAGLFAGEALEAARAAGGSTLNGYMSLAAPARCALRRRLSAILAVGAAEQARAEACLHPAAACLMHLPAAIGDYTDFYAGIHHAERVGALFRPDIPLLPNYKYVPIGYHGRSSTVRLSGAEVRRPNGQRKRPDDAAPTYGPCHSLDYELELGVWVGPGQSPGEIIPIDRAGEHIVGLCLLNDWSARDLQAWEYQPLGPFLAKSFLTSISPWVVTGEALAPFRTAQPPRPDGDPRPLDYLWSQADQAGGAFDIALEVELLTAAMRQAGRPALRLASIRSTELYWTIAQLIAHHASNGCALRPGDLFGTGTISSPAKDGCGSLLELTRGGAEPVALPDGETRAYLEDGDDVILRARCAREGFAPIGFGECRGRVTSAGHRQSTISLTLAP